MGTQSEYIPSNALSTERLYDTWSNVGMIMPSVPRYAIH